MDPHDPGAEVAGRRAEAIADEAALPIRVDDGHVVRTGTASWTDPTMTAAGVFYPEGVSSAEERLRYYASRFPVVEVDATYYALPQEAMSQRWVERTPGHFVFDVKAHALMTGQPTETRRLPKPIREELPEALREKARLYPKELPPELIDEVWAYFRRGIDPLVESGRLGGVPIAVEFRHGSWFNEKNAERTLRFLTDHAIPYVVVDEPQGFKSSVPPVVAATSPDLAVFRFHGRNAETWEKRDITPA